MIEARQDNVQDLRSELLPVMSQTSQRSGFLPGLRGRRRRVARGTGPSYGELDDRDRLAQTRPAPSHGKPQGRARLRGRQPPRQGSYC